MMENGENRQYLPGIRLPKNVFVSDDIKEVVNKAEIVIVSVPCTYFREALKMACGSINDNTIILSAAKGIEPGTYKRMSQIIREEIETGSAAVLSGPNHAEEVGRRLPTATVIASDNEKASETLKEIFTTGYFKVFTLKDVAGVEICGALKNITAIAVGVCDSLGFGDNAKGAIMTLGLSEMAGFVKAFGGRRETCYGLAGVGDLITTCESSHSRNRFVGMNLAQNKKLTDIKKEMRGMIAEGIETCKAAYEMGQRKSIRMPLTEQVYEVIYESKDLRKAISDLLDVV